MIDGFVVERGWTPDDIRMRGRPPPKKSVAVVVDERNNADWGSWNVHALQPQTGIIGKIMSKPCV